jgi:manganese/zinc/iron transport system ATP- binding protein
MEQKKSKPIISVKSLTVAYNQYPILQKINFHAEEGTLTGIIGPNGSGKTTLIKAIMNLIPAHSGSIEIYGEKHTKHLSKIAYVPQKNNIDWDFPINVFDMVLMGRYGHLAWCQRPTQKDIDIAWEALASVKMLPHAQTRINELSGGQQQRVCIARALAQQPEIYIMDEPFAAIDVKTETLLLELLQSLKKENKTIIVVHHNLSTIKQYFDWAFFMNMKEIAHGPVDEVMNDEIIKQTFNKPPCCAEYQQ